jgi:hypothetical protein
MAERGDAAVVAVARLETATAVVRRAPAYILPSPPGQLRLSPAARIVSVPQGAAELLAAIREGRPSPSAGPEDEPVLVLRRPVTFEVTIEPLGDALAELLGRASTAEERSALQAVVRSLGGEVDDADAIIDELVADAVLV